MSLSSLTSRPPLAYSKAFLEHQPQTAPFTHTPPVPSPAGLHVILAFISRISGISSGTGKPSGLRKKSV
jgi:hypothetical protein